MSQEFDVEKFKERLVKARDEKSFIRSKDKVHNSALGNDAAWLEAVPVIHEFIPGFPEQGFLPDQVKAVRTIFDIRRDAFVRGRSVSPQGSEIIQELGRKFGQSIDKPSMVIGTLFFFKPNPQAYFRRGR